MGKSGVLAQSASSSFSGKVFYLNRGKRHWVLSKDWIEENDFQFPEDVIQLPDEVILSFLPGQPATRAVDLRTVSITNVSEAREAAASQCRGSGLEIGAGSSPFPVPLHCQVQYGDMYSYEDLIRHAYTDQHLYDIVAPTVKTSLDRLDNILDESLDFIVACHVIEHTRDPIGAIHQAWKKLRPGGQIVLVIPSKPHTFDRNRSLTTLDHLIDDYRGVHVDRDQEHYKEFFSKADGFSDPEDGEEEKWFQEWKKGYSIHFHTWTYETFGAMVAWIDKNAVPFTEIWSHDVLPDGIEFYFTLTK
jgi:SAM-dependent methyltransferase